MDQASAASPVDYLAGSALAERPVAAEEPADHVGPHRELLADPAQHGHVAFGDEHPSGPIPSLPFPDRS